MRPELGIPLACFGLLVFLGSAFFTLYHADNKVPVGIFFACVAAILMLLGAYLERE